MANYTPVWRDGQRLTAWMLYVILLLNDELRARFGVSVIVSSAIRTYAEQEAIFRARYVTAGNVRGRRVYDTRWWNGQLWYRISSAGTVAVPGSSNHEIQGDRAAVDIRDSGSDAGITVASSARGRWIRDWCRRTGLLIASGDGFDEGWHFDVPGIFRTPPGSAPKPTPTPKPTPKPEEPTLEELMALKSVVIAAQSVGKAATIKDGCILDFEDGFKSEWGQVSDSYNTTMGRIFTTGGAVIVTRAHYDKLKKDFDTHIAGQRARALEIAKAQGKG